MTRNVLEQEYDIVVIGGGFIGLEVAAALRAAGAQVTVEDLRVTLEAARVARQKMPERVVLVDDLPRVPSGKVRKDVLRERAKEIAAAIA